MTHCKVWIKQHSFSDFIVEYDMKKAEILRDCFLEAGIESWIEFCE